MNVVLNEVVSNEWSQMNWSQLSAHQNMHIVSTNFAKTLVWKCEYDVTL